MKILGIFVVFALLVSCGGESTGPDTEPNPDSDPNTDSGPTTGTVEITTSTSGSDQDGDGYTVTLAENEEDISTNETISISGLDEGSYDAELSNIAGNCSVNGDNPRTITVTAGETVSTTFEINCQQMEPVTEKEAVDAVLQVIRDKGWTVPSKLVKTNSAPSTVSDAPSLLDYVATDVSDSGTRQVYLLIGPDGHIIPNTEWQQNNQGRCQNQELRYMKVPKKRFNMKLFSLADGYDVFAQYTDIETSEIEAQREGQSSSLVDAMTDAWDKIQKPIKKPGGPCGEKISEISLHFSSNTTHDLYHKDAGFSEITNEEVEATVALTYNEEDSMYVGSSDLEWLKYEYSEGDCDLPDNATAKVHKFVYGNPDDTNSDTELELQFRDFIRTSCNSPQIGSFDIYPDFSFVWWLLHENEIIEKKELDNWATTVEHIYGLYNWETVESSEKVIVRKTYNHTRTVEDEDARNNMSGETTIEVRRQSGSSKQ